MKKFSKGQTLVEYVLVVALVVSSLSGVYYIFKTSIISYWKFLSAIICSPLP
ncbi:MAG: hypothetical protein ABH873_07870 [Candidatus Firestonebacteria bacterium]